MLGAAVFSACDRAPARGRDPALRDVARTGRLQHDALTELSGLAPSSTSPGVFWGHNDSGNDAQLFAIDSTGAALARLRVAGATNRDWEAIAAGPCDAGACLYIGDVGDNDARRDDLRIWRVAEPSLPSSTSMASGDTTASAQSLRFRYEGGAHDVEAMWVAPDTSLWLVTKRMLETGRSDRSRADRRGGRRPALVFRLSADAWRTPDSIAVAQLVDSLPIVPGRTSDKSWITDASLSAPLSDGSRRLAVRTYYELYVFAADAQSGRPGALLGRCSLTGLAERSGEAVAWLPGGRVLLGNEGRRSVLHAGRCDPE